MSTFCYAKVNSGHFKKGTSNTPLEELPITPKDFLTK